MDANKMELDTDAVFAFLRAEDKKREKEAQLDRDIDKHARKLLSELFTLTSEEEVTLLERLCYNSPEETFYEILNDLYSAIDENHDDEKVVEDLQDASDLAELILDFAELLHDYEGASQDDDLLWDARYFKLDIFSELDINPILRDILLEIANRYFPDSEFDIHNPEERETLQLKQAKEREIRTRETNICDALKKEIKSIPFVHTFLHRADFEAFVDMLSETLAAEQPLPNKQLMSLGMGAGMTRKQCRMAINKARIQAGKIL